MAIGNPNITETVDFTHSDGRISELLERMHEITDLNALEALAEWDQNTSMPDGAGEVRGTQMATLHGLVHERWIEARMGTLLDELDEAVTSPGFTDADRGLVREARRFYDRSTKLPRQLVEEMVRVQAGSF